jgi:Acetylornithine deacetylase/Succinyl-diaminopimelate desuccinylase and related deacylases
MERRTIIGEADDTALAEVNEILAALKREDNEFEAAARYLFGRQPYQISTAHVLPQLLEDAVTQLGRSTHRSGMSFWTDAAILGQAGIPTVIFGPGGAGLHGLDEYVLTEDVIACRDALVELAHQFCG